MEKERLFGGREGANKMREGGNEGGPYRTPEVKNRMAHSWEYLSATHYFVY